MQLEEKKKIVKGFADEVKKAKSLIIVNYQGLKVNSLTELRRQLRQANCKIKVVKNKLAVKSLADFSEECFNDISKTFSGPTAVIIADEDPSRAVKIFKKYSEESPLMEFRAGVICDKFFNKEQIEKLVNLPSRDVLIAMTVNVLNSPIQGFYNTLTEVIRKFYYALNGIKNKIEKSEIEIPKKTATEEIIGDVKNNNETEGTGGVQ